MRHHKRIKSFVSRRVDGTIIGFGNSSIDPICGNKEELCIPTKSDRCKEVLK